MIVRDWIVCIVGGVIAGALCFVLGSTIWNPIGSLLQSSPDSIITYTAVILCIGSIIGYALGQAIGKRRIDKAEAIQSSENELMASDIGVKLTCLAAWNNHSKYRSHVYKTTELDGIFIQDGSRKASEAGFVRIEPCGLNEVRLEPTQKLLDLLEDRTDVLSKLVEAAARVIAPDLDHLSWRDIKISDSGGFEIADIKDDVAFRASAMKFAQEYKKRPFWQRYLMQQLVDGGSVFMLSGQYDSFLEQDFEGRDVMIAITPGQGNTYELSATEGIRYIFAEFPGIRDDVNDVDYVDAPEDHLRPSFGAKFEVGPVSWYTRP